ncbi:hypothetical protein KSF_079040 [Reticulibacter mediterranei]|uniref:GAF domain-containing protein n=1 Tax=Reticulibacter mediterranei TaxID=2778369 RepID=A0A8J3INK1_9CHLR|nr:GAF domain-containing protein [Reticulibacter mediterranei]GHO97856.1 hypothetical protein KSF_079040 [Reticulibacter mediterranei]
MSGQDWSAFRALLKELLRDSATRRLIEQRTDIAPRTLARWISGETEEPDSKRLSSLLDALPQHQSSLLMAIYKARPDFHLPLLDNTRRLAEDLPLDFLVRLLETNANTPHNLHFISIVHLIFLQLQATIDPNHLDLLIMVAQCTPPATPDAPVQSVREIIKMTTHQQQFLQAGARFFMGAESLSGYSVSLCQAGIVQNVREEQHLPVLRPSNKSSAAAYPIQRGGHVAGCLTVSSPQPDFFSPRLQYILQIYAHLLGLAFETHQFYPPDRIRLRSMPARDMQRPYLATIQERVLHLMQQNALLSRVQAEQCAWQQLEEAFLDLS